MSVRYFVAEPITGQHATLAAEEAHHLIHVLRARPGTEVVLFDGSGAEFSARVETVGRSSVELAILERRELNREGPRTVTVGVALPKGDRQKWLIEKLVELGVATVVPLETERGVAQPTESSLVRLRRSVVEASKQCGRNHLMPISTPRSAAEFFAGATSGRRLIAHPCADTSQRTVSPRPSAASDQHQGRQDDQPVWLAIGPEGGFTPEEVATALGLGFEQVDLGPRILRVETAAVALAAAMQIGVP